VKLAVFFVNTTFATPLIAPETVPSDKRRFSSANWRTRHLNKIIAQATGLRQRGRQFFNFKINSYSQIFWEFFYFFTLPLPFS
jgi:hypothetical protein